MPPSWSPEWESRYSFRDWTSSLLAWSILATDMDVPQQAAAIITQLQGSARDLVRNLSYEEITNGGMRDGQHQDPVTFLLGHLASHFSPLGEENRLEAMQELLSFNRQPGENIDGLLSRFLVLRHRAATNGTNLLMNWEGYSYLLLRACGCNEQQLISILQPLQQRFPNTEEEFNAVQLTLRRMGHILEGHPGNIASRLRGANARRLFAGPVMTQDDDQAAEHTSGTAIDPWHTGSDPWQPAQDQWQAAPVYPSVPASSHAYQSNTASDAQEAHQDIASSTDTDTISTADDLDYSAEDLHGMTGPQLDEHLFWEYQRAKGRWRKHMRKPTRRVRKFIRRKGSKGKGKGKSSSPFRGKGKGKGRNRFSFLAEMPEQEYDEISYLEVLPWTRRTKGEHPGLVLTFPF